MKSFFLTQAANTLTYYSRAEACHYCGCRCFRVRSYSCATDRLPSVNVDPDPENLNLEQLSESGVAQSKKLAELASATEELKRTKEALEQAERIVYDQRREGMQFVTKGHLPGSGSGERGMEV